jgi:hypothetical protein
MGWGFGLGFLNSPEVAAIQGIALPVELGAVAWYNFTDGSKIVEGATSVDVAGWKDSTTNGNDLSEADSSFQAVFTEPNGPITFTTDVLNGIPNTTGDFTYGTKLNVSTTAVGHNYIGNSSTNGNRVLIASGGGSIDLRTNNNTNLSFASSLSASTDYVIFITRTGNDYEIFVDKVSLGVVTNVDHFVPDRIGLRNNTASPFLGDMFEFMYFDEAKSLQDIQDLTDWMNR